MPNKVLADSALLDTIMLTNRADSVREDSAGAFYKVQYVQIKNYPSEVIQKKINTAISELIKNQISYNPENKPESINDALSVFVQDYKDYQAEIDVEFPQSWEQEVHTEVLMNKNGVLTLLLSLYAYTGGAHGNYYGAYYNFDLANGDTITLTDVVKPSFELEAKELVANYIRERFDLNEEQPLSEILFADTIVMNSNFGIGQDKINFLYNPYEVAPYAVGDICVPIPYSSVKKHLNTKGVLGRWLEP